MKWSDEELLDISMRNSYDVIINNVDAGEIVITDFGYFAHDFTRPLRKAEVTNMLYYFQSIEEYEKCIEIQKLLETIS